MPSKDDLERLSKAYVEAFYAAMPTNGSVAAKAQYVFEELQFHLSCMLLYFTSKEQKTNQPLKYLEPIAIAVSALQMLQNRGKEN